MTNNIIMNSVSATFGAAVSEVTGDLKPLLVSLLVALLSELVKYIRNKNNVKQQSTKTTIKDFFNGIVKSNKRG